MSVLKPPPGDYEVRAAIATEDGTRAASVIGYVNVPDVRKAGWVLSGVIVKSADRPTLQRMFAAGEPVGLAFQLARANGASPNVTVRGNRGERRPTCRAASGSAYGPVRLEMLDSARQAGVGVGMVR